LGAPVDLIVLHDRVTTGRKRSQAEFGSQAARHHDPKSVQARSGRERFDLSGQTVQTGFFLAGQFWHAEDAPQIGPSGQNMRRLQEAVRLAAKMGPGLAKREILFRTVP
jgi:hypothetical protein